MPKTKKDLMAVYARFLRDIGGTDGSEPGTYSLNHNSAYGGYQIILNGERGTESEPFGAGRRSLSGMCDVLYFACQAIEHINGVRVK